MASINIKYMLLMYEHVCSVCLTLSDCMECGPPVSSAYGVFQARILQSVVIPFSRESS